MGPAWYQREIAIPKEWKGKRIFVYFERTHWLSSIYVDTKEVSIDAYQQVLDLNLKGTVIPTLVFGAQMARPPLNPMTW